MRWLGLVVLLAACGQDDNFQDPTPNNLGKDPYDFAAMKYPRDFSATPLDDLAIANPDLANEDLGVDDLSRNEGHPDQ